MSNKPITEFIEKSMKGFLEISDEEQTKLLEFTTEELEKHWKKHHSWHWESNKEKTPEEALLKNQN